MVREALRISAINAAVFGDPSPGYVGYPERWLIANDAKRRKLLPPRSTLLVASSEIANIQDIKSSIQKSNLRMIAIAKKMGTVEENPKNPTTLTVFAKREILDSPKLNRLFGSERSSNDTA